MNQFWSGNECERAHTLTTATTGSKNSQNEATNQTSNQNSVLCPAKVPSLQILGLGSSQMQDTHSATISVDDNQLKCCCDQSVQLKQLRLVNLTENDAHLTFKPPC